MSSGPGEAVQPIVKEFDSIAALRANNTSQTTSPFSAHVAAYYCLSGTPCPPVTPDGGEGLFVMGKIGCTSSINDDGGSVIVDTLNECWYRQNINGDLRQFGLTLGSDYDCKHANISSCLAIDVTDANHPASPGILQNAEAAAEVAGIHRLTTSGVQIYLANAFSLDGDMTLDGGVGSPDVSNHNINSPGTIWTTDTASAIAMTLGGNAALQNLSLMPHFAFESGTGYPLR
jgi:hypothetical protein